MKRLTVISVCCILFSLSHFSNADPAQASSGNATGTSSVGIPDDWQLAKNVKAAFATNALLRNQHITVDSLQGVVELTGTVDSSDQAVAAGYVASKVPGVRAVHNNLNSKGVVHEPE